MKARPADGVKSLERETAPKVILEMEKAGKTAPTNPESYSVQASNGQVCLGLFIHLWHQLSLFGIHSNDYRLHDSAH